MKPMSLIAVCLLGLWCAGCRSRADPPKPQKRTTKFHSHELGKEITVVEEPSRKIRYEEEDR